ncbi:hypothetical protein [Thermoflexus sp.]|uniref:hypothetical protein n=1 Tax=Thermoflexus sp. TaxID=1969742 RepID=UPI002ADDD643|nr:hypothetical protein [Thermoflexus sp.]
MSLLEERAPRLREPLIMLAALALGLVWGVNALTNRDPLWFWPWFDQPAVEIRITTAGREYTFTPGMPGYERLNEALRQILSGLNIEGYEPQIGLSEATLSEYRQGMDALTVWARYDPPTQIHTAYFFPKADLLIIPLKGPHAELRPVFGALRGVIRLGALRLRDRRALEEAVQEVLP